MHTVKCVQIAALVRGARFKKGHAALMAARGQPRGDLVLQHRVCSRAECGGSRGDPRAVSVTLAVSVPRRRPTLPTRSVSRRVIIEATGSRGGQIAGVGPVAPVGGTYGKWEIENPGWFCAPLRAHARARARLEC